eukprot:3640482-Prymnesium_polylepis.1
MSQYLWACTHTHVCTAPKTDSCALCDGHARCRGASAVREPRRWPRARTCYRRQLGPSWPPGRCTQGSRTVRWTGRA